MAEKSAIDLLLEEEEKKESAAKEAAEAAKNAPPPPKMGVFQSMGRALLPSSKNMRLGTVRDILPGSPGQFADNARHALRLGGEIITYPVRALGGIANIVARNPRQGDYGVGETFEESGEGYNEYDFPLIGLRSPMGFAQEMSHDPLNALGLAGRYARAGVSLLGKAARSGAVNAAQESARPLMMDTEGDAIDDLKRIGGAGLAGFGLGWAGHGIKRLGSKLGLAKSALPPEQYNDLLLRLSRKNNVKPEILDEAASADARAKMRKGYKQEANISDKIIEYRSFDEAKFPENKTYHEFLGRSQSTATPDDAVKHLTDYGERTKKAAGGGGLTTVEQATQKRLPREAEIFYEQKPEAPAPESAFEVKTEKPILFNAEGKQIARSENPPRKVREMTAKELNNARQRIGKLLEDDFKRETLGRPDDEVKALKDAYFATRKHIMDIMEKEGEKEALAAYKKMGEKLKAREALFEALRVPNNKYAAQDALTRRLPNIYQNEKKAGLWGRLTDFDDKFDTDFAEQVKWNNMANTLGEGVGSHDFRLRGDNNWLTGKGWRSPFAKLSDRWTGGTVDAAARKLEAAKTAKGAQLGLSEYFVPRIYGRPEAQHGAKLGQAKKQEKKQAQTMDGRHLEIPARYWGNPYGGSKERDRLINNRLQE